MRQSRPSLEKIPGISKKRFEALPYAAVVLDQLLQKLGIQSVHLSAYGLREGLIFDGMTAELKQADPLVAAAEVMARRPGNPEGLGEALQRWLQEPFEQLDPVLPPVRERLPLE